jgi:Protein of unknown function (DUF3703)
MGRNSIVAVVGHARGQIRQFTLGWRQRVLEVHRGTEVDQRSKRVWVVGHCAVDVGVDRPVAVPTHRSEHLDRDWIGSGVVGVNEWYSSHLWYPSRTFHVASAHLTHLPVQPAVDAEFASASSLIATDPEKAFTHLERAHVLGQRATREHVRAHLAMLRWALRQNHKKELFGQILRLIGASTKTAIRLVPEGNTGGSNVSPFRRLPIPADLARTIEAAAR